MSFLLRWYLVSASMLMLSACAGLPSVTDACDPPPTAVTTIDSSDAEITQQGQCPSSIVASRFQTVGRVEQRSSQTRTVGVPRGFLVAMIVLLLIFGLA